MIKVTLTDNGYVVIDAAHADAILMDITPNHITADAKLLRIAQSFAPGADLTRMSFRKKRGISTMGWRAVFVDKGRQAAYVAAYDESHR